MYENTKQARQKNQKGPIDFVSECLILQKRHKTIIIYMNNPKLNTIIAPNECQYDDAFGFQSNGVAKAFMCDNNKQKVVYFDEKGNIINQ